MDEPKKIENENNIPLSTKEEVKKINNWAEICYYSPVNLETVEKYALEFETVITFPIYEDTLETARIKLFTAKSNLNMMIISLMQLLYDGNHVRDEKDSKLWAMLNFDLKGVMDATESPENRVKNISDPSSLIAYKQLLTTIYKSIFEAVKKTIIEWHLFNETESVRRNNKTFFYIFFQIFQISLIVLGSLKSVTGDKSKTLQSNIPPHYASLLSNKGEEYIEDAYLNMKLEKKSKKELDIPPVPSDFLEINEEVQNVNYY